MPQIQGLAEEKPELGLYGKGRGEGEPVQTLECIKKKNTMLCSRPVKS